MRAVGLDHAIVQHAERGIVIGICGGMQMLGVCIEDPLAVESAGTEPGLGLLPIRTKMNREKTTREATGQLLAETLFGSNMQSLHLGGYEIHIGETQYLEGSAPLARISRLGDTGSVLDGCASANDRVIGTYLHGIFHEDRFRHSFLQAARNACHLGPAAELVDWKRLREAEFDRLAKTVADSVDLKRSLRYVGVRWPVEETLCARAH
jgi:adenosylcobyric acid synthase